MYYADPAIAHFKGLVQFMSYCEVFFGANVQKRTNSAFSRRKWNWAMTCRWRFEIVCANKLNIPRVSRDRNKTSHRYSVSAEEDTRARGYTLFQWSYIAKGQSAVAYFSAMRWKSMLHLSTPCRWPTFLMIIRQKPLNLAFSVTVHCAACVSFWPFWLFHLTCF